MHTEGVSGEGLKRVCRRLHCAAVLILCIAICGCVAGKSLYLPADPSRPAAQSSPKVEGPPAVAVLDFTWEGHPSFEVGRDYNNVRAIVWKGHFGRTMADMIAGVLAEKGVPAVRAPGEAGVPAGVPSRVWGSVQEFHVNVKGIGSLNVVAESVVNIRIYASGATAPPGWSSAVGSTYWFTSPLFITPEDVLQAVNGAANFAAEEGVRRLAESGMLVVPGTVEKTGTEPKK